MKKVHPHLFAMFLVSLMLLGIVSHLGSTTSTYTLTTGTVTQAPSKTPPGWEKRGKEKEPAVERLPWWGDLVDIEYTWSSGNGSGVYVVVIDTGLVKQWKNKIPQESVETSLAKSFVGKESDWNMDQEGHGTAVTSVITGYYYNEENFVLGIAGDAKIIPIRVETEFMDAAGFKEILTQIRDAINYAVWLHTDVSSPIVGDPMVISMSLGWTDEWISAFDAGFESEAVHTAITDAISWGIIVSVSAGNEGPALNTLGYPGKWEEDIATGSAGWNDGDGDESVWEDVPEGSVNGVYLADYSSRGSELDVVGPGDLLVLPYTRGRLYWVSGTSFSCPVVTAIAALILEQNADLNQDDVEIILQDTTIDMGDSGPDPHWGHGLVQADSAVTSVPPA